MARTRRSISSFRMLTGDWVEYEDAAKLESENAELRRWKGGGPPQTFAQAQEAFERYGTAEILGCSHAGVIRRYSELKAARHELIQTALSEGVARHQGGGPNATGSPALLIEASAEVQCLTPTFCGPAEGRSSCSACGLLDDIRTALDSQGGGVRPSEEVQRYGLKAEVERSQGTFGVLEDAAGGFVAFEDYRNLEIDPRRPA